MIQLITHCLSSGNHVKIMDCSATVKCVTTDPQSHCELRGKTGQFNIKSGYLLKQSVCHDLRIKGVHTANQFVVYVFFKPHLQPMDFDILACLAAAHHFVFCDGLSYR